MSTWITAVALVIGGAILFQKVQLANRFRPESAKPNPMRKGSEAGSDTNASGSLSLHAGSSANLAQNVGSAAQSDETTARERPKPLLLTPGMPAALIEGALKKVASIKPSAREREIIANFPKTEFGESLQQFFLAIRSDMPMQDRAILFHYVVGQERMAGPQSIADLTAAQAAIPNERGFRNQRAMFGTLMYMAQNSFGGAQRGK